MYRFFICVTERISRDLAAIRYGVHTAILAVAIISQASSLSAQKAAESLLADAAALYQGAATPQQTLIEIRGLLDRIVHDHPGSDIALQILLRENVGVLDVAAIEAVAGVVGSTPIVDAPGDAQACLEEAMAGQVEVPITVTFLVDDGGSVDGLPDLRDPVAADAAARRTFFAVVTAMDGCPPFDDGLRGQELAASLTPDGAVDIRAVATQPAGSSAVAGLSAQPPASADADASPSPKVQVATQAAPNVATVPVAPALPPAGTDATMDALDLDRSAIRDLQARLLVSGHDPNGIDGVIGPGTRSAIRAWQAAQGISANGLLNEAQMRVLETETAAPLAAWLQDPQKAALYAPPPPIALGPGNVAGRWNFTTTCGPNSKLGQRRITGAMVIRHAGGNRYTGSVRNSQGLNGDFSGRLSGRQMQAVVDWGLFIGKVQVSGRIADQSLTVSGRDSNGCSFYSVRS